jgi:hypothetical protein
MCGAAEKTCGLFLQNSGAKLGPGAFSVNEVIPAPLEAGKMRTGNPMG